MRLRRARTGVKQRECAEKALARRSSDQDRQGKATSSQTFVSGVRFSRSFQEANPESILLEAEFGPGLSYQLSSPPFEKTTS
jgi:hypothetical protein